MSDHLYRLLGMKDVRIARLEEALRKIWQWQLPRVPDRDGRLTSYGSAYGSNGERDYIRSVARTALDSMP